VVQQDAAMGGSVVVGETTVDLPMAVTNLSRPEAAAGGGGVMGMGVGAGAGSATKMCVSLESTKDEAGEETNHLQVEVEKQVCGLSSAWRRPCVCTN
jgi:hypothetical protein